jgi:hypothetical protein
MTAPERFADSQIPLAPRAPSIHDPFQTYGFLIPFDTQPVALPGGSLHPAVRAAEHWVRDRQSDRSGGADIDCQLEARRHPDR